MNCALITRQIHNNADYNRTISLFNPEITKAPYLGDQALLEDDNDIIQFSTSITTHTDQAATEVTDTISHL